MAEKMLQPSDEKLLQARNTGEQNEIPVAAPSAEAAHDHTEAALSSPEQIAEQQAAAAEKARQKALELAKESREQQLLHDDAEQRPEDQPHSFAMHQELKAGSLATSMRNIQRKLPPASRAFSRFIHDKRVDTVSTIAGNTVARPSGMLGGSLCALLGSLLLAYLTRHYGFPYNYTMFLLFFVGGFLVGLILEPLIIALHRRRTR
ncbi:hypothetical protein CR970_00130 [Candidatus Saccharibacteria bacterium]|nr:MAG: hypothetical protein CR970_00130 [Candidatus Saccharibacteria bacterium]